MYDAKQQMLCAFFPHSLLFIVISGFAIPSLACLSDCVKACPKYMVKSMVFFMHIVILPGRHIGGEVGTVISIYKFGCASDILPVCWVSAT